MYIGNDLSRGRVETYYYTSTSGGETAITTDTSGKTINYTVGWVSVFLNGVRLHDSDFTATTGNSITGLAALSQADVVIIEAKHTFSSDDSVPATGGTFSGNGTHSGTVTNSSTTTHTGAVTNSSTTTTTGDATHNGNIIMATNKKIKQKGEAYIHSSHQSWVLGG